MKRMMAVTGLALAMCGVAGYGVAQAPAGAPAGANGICKDGTYSTAASKQGACRGHNGVQTWYAAAAATAPAGGAMTKPSTMPAPTPAPSVASKPAPTPAAAAPPAAPAPTASTNAAAKKGPAASAANRAQAPGGGPGLVWVNTESNVYHCNGDTYYGKTKAGQYMSEADAKAKGAHGDHGKVCTGK